MSKKSDTPYYIGLGIIILIFGYFAVTNVIDYINKDKVVTSNRTEDRAPVGDKFLKKFNKVPDFEFVNQNGDTISNKDLLGSVYIVDFFFTSCPTICTPMSANLASIVDELEEYDDFTAVSISIDPTYDTTEVLKKYASKFDFPEGKWHFLTGDQEAIFKLSRTGFNSFVDRSDNEAVGFEHSGNFALVDRYGYIRSRSIILDGDNKNWIYSYAGVAEGEFQPAQIEEITQDAITLLNK